MKILIGLVEIAGSYTNLKKGFEELGIDCTFLSAGHPFQYGEDEETSERLLVQLFKYAGRKRASTPRSKLLLKIWWKGLYHFLLVPLFLQAIFQYDVFIFTDASSFFFYRDLPILKLLNKKIIYVFTGSDSRPPYINGAFMSVSDGLTVDQCMELTRKKKQALRVIERYADAIVCHHLSAHLHERAFVPFLLMGIPTYPAIRYQPTTESAEGHDVRILHAPSRPEAKGSDEFRCVIHNLKSKGYAIEFVEITGKPNSVVMDELSRCDFVIDQLYSDVRMAGFAAEAALFDKPAVVAGYADDGFLEIKGVYPTSQFPPVHFCHPEMIEEAIEKLILDRDYRKELGRRARQFVENHWTRKSVAARYLRLIEGKIPSEWMYDPNQIRYLHGGCMPEWRTREVVGAVIGKGGVSSLRLADKSELERLFMEFAEVDPNSV